MKNWMKNILLTSHNIRYSFYSDKTNTDEADELDITLAIWKAELPYLWHYKLLIMLLI